MLQRKFETVMFCTQSQLIPKQIRRQPEQESSWPHIDGIFSGRRRTAWIRHWWSGRRRCRWLARSRRTPPPCTGRSPGTPPPPAHQAAASGRVTTLAAPPLPVAVCTHMLVCTSYNSKVIAPSTKECNYRICVGQTNSSLTKFIWNSISLNVNTFLYKP